VSRCYDDRPIESIETMANSGRNERSELRRNWGVVCFLAAAALFLFGRARTGQPVELTFAEEAARTRQCRYCGQKFLSASGQCTTCGSRDSRSLPEPVRTRATKTPVGPSIRVLTPLDPEALKAEGKGSPKN
jgi:hypothetical protein